MILLACLVLMDVGGMGGVFLHPDALKARDRFGEPAVTARLLREYRQLPPLRQPDWRPLEAKWTFALGDPSEGLNTSLKRLPLSLEPVSLPHRILHADTPYWYSTTVRISRASVLDIRADDGAQLYVDGKRVKIDDGVFNVTGSKTPIRLIVRVLNKALYGGLAGVRVASRTMYDDCRMTSLFRKRLDALVRKVRLLRSPSQQQLSVVRRAVRLCSASNLNKAEKQLSDTPLTIVGPYLQLTSASGMAIVWETDVPCAATIDWGQGYSLTKRLPAKYESNLHIVELSPLKPGEIYSYRVHSGKVASERYMFRMFPEKGPFEFTVWADSQNGWDVFRQNVNAMRSVPASFTVGVGDLVSDAIQKEPWIDLFDTLAPIVAETPFMMVGGNHDYDSCFEDLRSPFFDRYARTKPKPQYFAWTVGNARFVALDANIYYPTGIPEGSAEHQWLMKELASPVWKRATWHFLFIHQPPYSQGWAEYHGDEPIRELFDSLIEKHKIDFIVAGHTHDYERWTKTYGKQKTHYFIVGGAGGGLEDEAMSEYPVMDKVIRRHHFGRFRIDGNHVIFEAISTDTHVLDHFETRK